MGIRRLDTARGESRPKGWMEIFGKAACVRCSWRSHEVSGHMGAVARASRQRMNDVVQVTLTDELERHAEHPVSVTGPH